MRSYESPFNDPAYNLSLEEYIFRSFKNEDILIVWQNTPCVIIGKNQHILAEVDTLLAKELDIPVIRRTTGGGAVFQDMGNVNFSFLTDEKGDDDPFAFFARKLLAALETLGVEAEYNGRNDICSYGGKISGSASKSQNGRLLHHCTMLVDTDVALMERLLTPDRAKLMHSGVKSVSARVKNLVDIRAGITPTAVINAVKAQFGEMPPLSLQGEARAEIQAIRAEKYSREAWNRGIL